jgi:hypothetical protein
VCERDALVDFQVPTYYWHGSPVVGLLIASNHAELRAEVANRVLRIVRQTGDLDGASVIRR